MNPLLPPGCTWWKRGDSTMHPPHDERFLSEILDAGFAAFTGAGGLFGGTNADREAVVIHRGMGRKWEVILVEHEKEIASTITTDLKSGTNIAIAWLGNEPAERAKHALAALEVYNRKDEPPRLI